MAEIILTDADINYEGYLGNGDFDIASGKHLKIETSPGGEEKLNAVVPEGKQWRVQINIRITETDA